MWTLRRRAARVVVLDPGLRVLLLRASDPARRERGSWWELPGGGIDGSEPAASAAARELYEETGIRDAVMGPCVWLQHASYTYAGLQFEQDEQIFVASAPASSGDQAEIDYRPPGLEALEAAAFSGARWWTMAELAGLAASGERVIPPWLGAQLPALVDGRTDGVVPWPAQPIDMGPIGDVLAG